MLDIRTLRPRPHNIALGRLFASMVSLDAGQKGITLDANDLTAVFSRQLEWIDGKLQETKFAPTKAEDLIPFDPRGGPGVNQVTWQKVTELGSAKIVGNGDTTVPMVDAVGDEYTRDVKNLGAGYRYSVFDLLNIAQNPTIKLDARRKQAAQNAIRRLHDTLAFIGSANHGITGLFNDANVPLVTPITGDWLNVSTTPLLVQADLNKLTWAAYIATKENFEIDTLIIPTSVGQKFDEPIGTDANKTLRKFVLDNSPHIKRIETSHHLETASAGGGIRAVAYKKSDEVLVYGQNEMFSEEPPQRKGFNIEVPCHGRASGLQIFQPLAIAYMDID